MLQIQAQAPVLSVKVLVPVHVQVVLRLTVGTVQVKKSIFMQFESLMAMFISLSCLVVVVDQGTVEPVVLVVVPIRSL
jgi:hypothetical protein